MTLSIAAQIGIVVGAIAFFIAILPPFLRWLTNPRHSIRKDIADGPFADRQGDARAVSENEAIADRFGKGGHGR